MAHVTLAEWQGRVWLVGGEEYIDDLLANTLPAEISIDIVPCDQKSDINALYAQLCGTLEGVYGDPYLIHPAIVNRIKRTISSTSVFFSEWSAAFDQDARDLIEATAQWAVANPASPIDLIAFLDPDGPPALAGLAGLRQQLIADALTAAGVAPDRISRVTRAPADMARLAQDGQRIDIAVKPPAA